MRHKPLQLIELPFKFAAMSHLMAYAVIRVGDSTMALKGMQTQYFANCGTTFLARQRNKS